MTQHESEISRTGAGLDVHEIAKIPARRRLELPGHECLICLGEHSQETHDATLSVHGWFRGEVTRYLN